MKARALIATLAALLSVSIAGSAQATGIAGWDFSQYFGSGFLTTDGGTFVDTLDANYSNLDPTFNAGAESAAFGTMYMDGTNGSDQVPNLGTGLETFVPFTGSLASNLAFAPASNPFDSWTILASEGQLFTTALSMTALDAIDVVFGADLGSVPDLGTDWTIAFGGKTLSGGSTVGIAFSTNGVDFSHVANVNLTDVDTLFSVNLGAVAADDAFVRLSFQAPAGGGVGQALIDNVTIGATLVPIPEPGTALLLAAGLLGLARFGRRRS